VDQSSWHYSNLEFDLRFRSYIISNFDSNQAVYLLLYIIFMYSSIAKQIFPSPTKLQQDAIHFVALSLSVLQSFYVSRSHYERKDSISWENYMADSHKPKCFANVLCHLRQDITMNARIKTRNYISVYPIGLRLCNQDTEFCSVYIRDSNSSPPKRSYSAGFSRKLCFQGKEPFLCVP
jgi:hypothetical protein